jgi:transcription antitermination factor NusA-like protein
MKFPICSKCLRRKLICDSCADVVADFGIKHKEIEMMRKLHKKMKNYEILKKVEIRRAVDNGNMVVIIADRESASLLIGRDGGMIKQLGREIGRHIRVVPISSTPE